jgi:hypothetical protein
MPLGELPDVVLEQRLSVAVVELRFEAVDHVHDLLRFQVLGDRERLESARVEFADDGGDKLWIGKLHCFASQKIGCDLNDLAVVELRRRVS